MMHDEKLIKQLYAWLFRQSACIKICFETRQPRYRVQDGLWPNHKNFIFEVTFIFSKNVLNTLHFYIKYIYFLMANQLQTRKKNLTLHLLGVP